MSQIVSNSDVLFSGALVSLVAIPATILLTMLVNWTVTWLKAKAVKRVLFQEVGVCAEFAGTLCDVDPGEGKRIQSPLYRLPTSAFEAGFPTIIDWLTETDARTLIKFYAQVETLNRGLDDAAAIAMGAKGLLSLDDVDSRNQLSA